MSRPSAQCPGTSRTVRASAENELFFSDSGAHDAKSGIGGVRGTKARFGIGGAIGAAAERFARAIRGDCPFGHVAVEIEDQLQALLSRAAQAADLAKQGRIAGQQLDFL